MLVCDCVTEASMFHKTQYVCLSCRKIDNLNALSLRVPKLCVVLVELSKHVLNKHCFVFHLKSVWC